MKLSKELLGYYLGLLSVFIIIVVMIVVSLLDPNYRIFYNVVSLLGVGEGEEIFNSSIIIIGILQIPLFYSLKRDLEKITEIKSVITYSAFISGIIFCISEIAIGIFPLKRGFVIAHGIAAFFYFHGSLFTILLFCILILHDNNKNLIAYFGFIVILMILNFQFWRTNLLEWIAVLSIYFWIAITSIYFIK